MSKPNAPSNQRQLRIGEELRHALAWIMERGEIRDPDLAGLTITITEVRVSADLRQAMVFVVALGGGRANGLVGALDRAKGFLRRRVAETVRLRFVPELSFRADQSFDTADRIGRALRDPLVARDLDDNSNNDEENG
jgi:ribosome-binding factor A